MVTVSEAFQLALQNHRANRIDQAKQLYHQILAKQPDHVDALLGLSSLCQRQGQYVTAEKFLRKVLTIQPASIKAWFSLGNLRQAENRLNAASEAYRRVLELEPNLVAAYNNLGYTLEQQGEWNAAIACYEKALALQPNCTEADVNLGNVLQAQGKLTYEKQNYYAELNHKLGSMRQKEGNLDASVVCYQQAIAFNPNVAKTYRNLGDVLVAKGEFEASSTCHYQAMKLKYSQLPIKQSLPYDNIYHCCIQKTASQWFRAIFNDPIFYQYTGLLVYPYNQPGLGQASFDKAFPQKAIATHLYIDYPTYLSIPKPTRYKAFFMQRDPRDIVISFYFSTKYSHSLIAYIPEMRRALEQLNFQEGLKYAIDRLEEMGLFQAQKSWVKAFGGERNLQVFNYEDFADDNFIFLKKLLDYLTILIPEEKLIELSEKHQFKGYAKGRIQGEEDIYSHYRKGEPGDWKNHFSEAIMTYFTQVTGNLIEKLGYQT